MTAISIATKWKQGKDTGEPCIRFYVERKVPRPAIPAESMLPATYQDVPTDVIESGRFVASAVLPGLPVKVRTGTGDGSALTRYIPVWNPPFLGRAKPQRLVDIQGVLGDERFWTCGG